MQKRCATTLQKVQVVLQTLFYDATTAGKRAHNLQIVQLQLQKCNSFTKGAIIFTNRATNFAFQLYKLNSLKRLLYTIHRY